MEAVKYQIPNHYQCPVIADNIQGMEAISKSKYIFGSAHATLVENQDETQKAMQRLIAKFPFMSDLPSVPAEMVIVRLDLKKVVVTDNTLGFGHTEDVFF